MATSSSPSLSSEDIFNNHYPALQSLCDPVSVTRLLYGELMLTGEVLNDVESAGPSLKKQREALLVAVKEAVQIRDRNLQTFASVLCKFTGNMKLGTAIHRDYDEAFTKSDEVTLETDKDIHITTTPKRNSEEFSSLHDLFLKLFKSLMDLITKSAKSVEDVRKFIESFTSQLEGELIVAESMWDLLLVIRRNTSLVDVEMFYALNDQLQLPNGKDLLDNYQKELEKFSESVSLRLCASESFETIRTHPPLKCESAAFNFEWAPDDKKLKEVQDMLSQSTGKLMKLHSVETTSDSSGSVFVHCTFPYSLMGAAIATVHDNIQLLKSKGLLKITIGYLTVWKRQIQDIRSREIESKSSEEAETPASVPPEDRPKTISELEETVKRLSETLKDKEDEVEELTEILQKIKEGTPLERKVSELKLQLKEEKERESSLREKIKEMEEALKDPEAYEKKKLTAELDRLKLEKKQKEEKLLKEGEEEISVLRSKLKELEEQLAEKEEENKSLTESLKALQSQLTDSKASEADDAPQQPLEDPTSPS